MIGDHNNLQVLSNTSHWCKFGVHMLSCSHDRAIFPNENSSISRKAVFPHWSRKNSSISGI